MEITKIYLDEIELSNQKMIELKKIYPHLASYFNTFWNANGANCLASTLAALSESDVQINWIITKWVTQDSFFHGLVNYHYDALDSSSIRSLNPKDVLVWKGEENALLHATFYLGDGYFFNKDGQSFINPWQIVTLEKLISTWGNENISVYRKTQLYI
ncbi:hypothetical protein [Ornithinibacillus xuwenensis]|uniref:NlpC/P60 domain-containing protein n=1 Tax=Ornithinibacillus xuwenensis TaxID=3144668 RepID=A0ABU9XDH8_9BACI